MSRAGPSEAAAARALVATPPCTLLIVRPPPELPVCNCPQLQGRGDATLLIWGKREEKLVAGHKN